MKFIRLMQLNLFLITTIISLYSMQKDEKKSFFATINNSSKRYAYVSHRTFVVNPNQKYLDETEHHRDMLPQETLKDLVISRKPLKLILIRTKQGCFEMSADANNKINVYLSKPQKTENKYMSSSNNTQEIDALNNSISNPIIATVNGDGFVSVEMTMPMDGRPDLSLIIYKKLLGQAIYATPQFILGLDSLNKDNPVVVYAKKAEEWRQKNDSDKDDVIKLLTWAASKRSK